MIKALNLSQYSTSFCSNQPEKNKKVEDETRILPSNIRTRLKQNIQKTESAIIDYPVKGFRGDINSNFYEFLSMGIVPYILGSAMFMIGFNCINKILERPMDSALGKKIGLGVVLYGILKSASKPLVTAPVKAFTGVDTEMPYQNKVYPLPTRQGEDATIDPQYQQRKVFDSKEFYRKDLLDRNYFDNIAKKLGLGDNLNDSITETSPIIQNIVATTNTAKSLSSYMWAGLGVALAMQDSWLDLFDAVSNRKHYVAKPDEKIFQKIGGKLQSFFNNSFDITKTFGKSFIRSCKSLWDGPATQKGYMKHAGKVFIGIATAMTVALTANSIIRAKEMAKNKNAKTIDKSKESTVI